MFLALGFAISAGNVLADGIGNLSSADCPVGRCIMEEVSNRSGGFWRGGDGHMGYMMNNGGYFGFGWITQVIFWALIIGGIIYAVKYLSRNENKQIQNVTTKKEKSPLEVLKYRYAKGEIDKEEYDKIKKDLE